MGCAVCHKIHTLKSQPPDPPNVTRFGNRAFVQVIVRMRAFWKGGCADPAGGSWTQARTRQRTPRAEAARPRSPGALGSWGRGCSTSPLHPRGGAALRARRSRTSSSGTVREEMSAVSTPVCEPSTLTQLSVFLKRNKYVLQGSLRTPCCSPKLRRWSQSQSVSSFRVQQRWPGPCSVPAAGPGA